MHSCLDYRMFTSKSFSFSRRNIERHGAALYCKCSSNVESKRGVTEAIVLAVDGASAHTLV